MRRFVELAGCLAPAMVLSVAAPSWAAEKDDANKAANQILASLDDKEFDRLWDTQSSEFLKKQTSKEAFVANVRTGRSQMGKILESRLVDVTPRDGDEKSGFKGRIYVFQYVNSYAIGKFFERVIVAQENDGVFRLAGLWGTPAPAMEQKK